MSYTLFRMFILKDDYSLPIFSKTKKCKTRKLSLFGRLKKKYSHYIRHKKYIKSKINGKFN